MEKGSSDTTAHFLYYIRDSLTERQPMCVIGIHKAMQQVYPGPHNSMLCNANAMP
jgi:hypothetical protein